MNPPEWYEIWWLWFLNRSRNLTISRDPQSELSLQAAAPAARFVLGSVPKVLRKPARLRSEGVYLSK
jgi:hypothetical protein